MKQCCTILLFIKTKSYKVDYVNYINEIIAIVVVTVVEPFCHCGSAQCDD